VPIILGNADVSPPPEKPPANEGEKKPTGAGPALPLEKVPAAGLAEPAEKIPTAAAPEVPRVYFPFPISMSDVEAVISRFSKAITPTDTGTAAPPKQ
jgi:hypothetical protein